MFFPSAINIILNLSKEKQTQEDRNCHTKPDPRFTVQDKKLDIESKKMLH